ncbi:hypothetical protein [Bordetella sp. LUAb4]|uniref:hypothetical protein n=1 Tax=Bordetella sp. LUAb4 TaxID=2843195 RepID=UPI001E368066|nr:hypothetical protein [Bordetella sp. LUAb4]
MKTTYRFQAITERSTLEGTAYVELMGGAYENQCWNEGSLFFHEEVFGYLEPTIENYVSSYDHFAFTQINMTDWRKIVAELSNVSELLNIEASRSTALDQIGFIFMNSRHEFTEHADQNCAAFGALIRQIEEWTKRQQSAYDCVTVLGI